MKTDLLNFNLWYTEANGGSLDDVKIMAQLEKNGNTNKPVNLIREQILIVSYLSCLLWIYHFQYL